MSGHHLKYIFAVTKIDADVTFFSFQAKATELEKEFENPIAKTKTCDETRVGGIRIPDRGAAFRELHFRELESVTQKIEKQTSDPKR